MGIKKTLTALALVGLLGVVACNDEGEGEPDAPPPEGAAQQAPPGMQQDMDPEMMALMMEMQELEQRIAPIQQEAMQDESLASQLTELQNRVETAMREENEEAFEQMEELEQEFFAAQEAGDEQRAQEIGLEAQGVQMELQTLQQSVIDRPDFRESIDAFEEEQRARMVEIDPEADEIIQRIEEIMDELDLQ